MKLMPTSKNRVKVELSVTEDVSITVELVDEISTHKAVIYLPDNVKAVTAPEDNAIYLQLDKDGRIDCDDKGTSDCPHTVPGNDHEPVIRAWCTQVCKAYQKEEA